MVVISMTDSLFLGRLLALTAFSSGRGLTKADSLPRLPIDLLDSIDVLLQILDLVHDITGFGGVLGGGLVGCGGPPENLARVLD